MRVVIFGLVGAACLAACGDSDSDQTAVDTELRAIIDAKQLTGRPQTDQDLPSIDDPLPTLGKRLFFSQSLGGDVDAACVTCHHPVLGGGDGLALSIGVGAEDPELLGPGRQHPDGDSTVPRNAPTTFNVALFQQGLFWDGRVENLGAEGIRTPDSEFGVADTDAGASLPVAQARFPVTSAEEMRGFEFVAGGTNAELRMALETRLAAQGWSAEMQAVFGSEDVTFGRVAEAIAAYEASQVFIDTPWRAYIEGDDEALSPAAKRGALLFFSERGEGGANCASCHAGDFFSNESFWALAAPQIGRGKGDGASGTSDFGRERETGNPSDRYTFRTPSLLNVAVTGPYFHSGAYSELEQVIRHHIDPVGASGRFDTSSVPTVETTDFEANRQEMLAFLQSSNRTIPYFDAPLELEADEIDDLVAFLEALTDPCVVDRDCLAPWIAGPQDDVDGSLLIAVDRDGRPL